MSGDEQSVRGVRVAGVDTDAHAAGEHGACHALDFMKGSYSRGLSESRPQCGGITGGRVGLHAPGDRGLRGNYIACEAAVRTHGQNPPKLPARITIRSTLNASFTEGQDFV